MPNGPSFHDFEISKHTHKALQRRGIDAPFPIQSLVLKDALAGNDVLAHAPTGSGKTLAFAIPIVERIKPDAHRPAAVVLVPTRELCVQVVGEFEWLLRDSKLKVAAVYGGTKISQQAKEAAHAHIVVATPGRLIDIEQRRLIDISDVQILVLDEADRMLDMGFQPQTDKIVARMPKDRHTMFFSATLEGKAGRVAKAYTRDAVHFEFERPEAEKGDIAHRFVRVNRGTKVGTLIETLESEEDRGLTLVFVRTKRGADELVKDVNRRGVPAEALHGDMVQAAREKTLKRFENGEINTLIATDVAARGLDLDDITHVIQFDAPDDKVDFVHRSGRTGRAGRTGKCITFVQEDQSYHIGRIAVALQLEEQYAETGLKIMAPRMAYQTRGGNRKLGVRQGGFSTHRKR